MRRPQTSTPNLAAALLLLGTTLIPSVARAQTVSLTDPTGDAVGPGSYVYPTDEAYVPGSFDLTGMKLFVAGSRATFTVTFAQPLQDPWAMGVGFSLQTVFIFIDSREGGHREAPPGLNVQFQEESAWETCIVLSPQQPARLRRRTEALMGDLAKSLILPDRTVGRGSTLTAQVRTEDLGDGDPTTWGYQVAVLATDNLPEEGHLFTQRVEEAQSRLHFGGASGEGCGPNVIDILGGSERLQYECKMTGSARKEATLTMVYVKLARRPASAGLRQTEKALPEGDIQDPRP